MPMNFPSSPSLNQTYTSGSRTWRWDGQGWALAPSGTCYYSNSAPTNAVSGDRWINSDTGIEATYINDGDSGQWVETGRTAGTNGGATAFGGMFLNSNTITNATTIPTGFNGLSAGPVTIATGVTVTVSSGSTWAVV